MASVAHRRPGPPRHAGAAATAVRATTPRSGFRPDIEGLRAFAVVLVILDHLGLFPRGGFIGVDVFFVISGFLITGLLLREIATHGRISYRTFYARRARRILPAGLTVLAVAWFAADHYFRGVRVSDTHTDIRWAFGFAANIHFARIGTDYFQANRAVSPVQHYWSLAVEEQFYVVWPFVLLVVFTLGRRLHKPRAAGLLFPAVVIAAIAASFGWALHETHVAPAAAYFSTSVRAWELGIGALAALLVHRYPGFPRRLGRLRGPLVLTGLVTVVLSAVLIRSSSGFPAPAALTPVLGAALVMLAGAGGPTGRWSTPLTNPVSGYVGRISYSLYLWHYPVIVFAAAAVPPAATVYRPMVIAAMLGLSVFSYHVIETPFRRPITWRPRAGGVRRLRAAVTAIRPAVPLCIALCLTLTAGLYALRPPPPHPVLPRAVAAVSPSRPGVATPTATLQASIVRALGAASFPAFTPSLNHVSPTAARNDWAPCETAVSVLPGCTFHDPGQPTDPGRVAVVIGDSISLAWLPTVKAALLPRGWTVYGLALQQCPAADVATNTISNARNLGSAACSAHQAYVLRETVALKPSLVFLSQTQRTLDCLVSGATGAAATAQYEQGMERTERAIVAPGRRIVTLSPPPGGLALTACDTLGAVPASCVQAVVPAWHTQAGADAQAARAVGTTYLDTELWFCSTGELCPAFVGTTPVYDDGEHLTSAYAHALGPQLAASLQLT